MKTTEYENEEFKEYMEYLQDDLDYFKIKNYTINPDGTVDVDGNVNLSKVKGMRCEIKFGKVSGDFICYNMKLTSLEFTPSYVGGNFDCQLNKLKSLEGGPSYVGGNFDCKYNKLKSLKGSPSYVGGNFDCSDNKLNADEVAKYIVGNTPDINDFKYNGDNYDLRNNPVDYDDFIIAIRKEKLNLILN